MRDLTQGELRYINESADSWQMAIYSKCQTVTPELEQHFHKLADAYRNAFSAFYIDALQKGEVTDIEAAQREFDAAYEKQHPEFYDVEALVRGE